MKITETLDKIVPMLITFEHRLYQDRQCGDYSGEGYWDVFQGRLLMEDQNVFIQYAEARAKHQDNSSHILRDALVGVTTYSEYTSPQELQQCIQKHCKQVGDEGHWALCLYHNLIYLQETMREWSSLIKVLEW